MNKTLDQMNGVERLYHEVMPMTLQDMYKSFHKFATKKGVEYNYSNLTPRHDKHSNTELTGVVCVGAQYLVKEILIKLFNRDFFQRPKDEVIAEYKYFIEGALFKDIDTSHIEALHDLGYLPLNIKTLPEGTFVPYGVPMITMQNTVAGYGWLVGALEDEDSAEIWPIATSATTALNYMINFEKSKLAKEALPFMGHDFSYRGLPGHVAAGMIGFGHLTSFYGSDTTPAAIFAWKYYGADPGGAFAGRPVAPTFASVNATEHSVMCSYGQDGEKESIEHIMTNVAPTGILSLVMDAWDFWKVVTEYLPELKDKIMVRDGTLVIRPDSGDPVKIICGYKLFNKFKFDTRDDALTHASMYPQDTYNYEAYELEDGRFIELDSGNYLEKHEVKGLIECLWDTFGGTVDADGFRMLDSHIGAIYGDSITLARQKEIIAKLEAKKFIPSCVLGIGSYTYQYVTRDTHGFAMKSTAIKFEGDSEWTPIFKQPKTDSAKNSAKGLMMVQSFNDNTMYAVIQEATELQEQRGALQTIFLNGELVKETTLEEIRANVRNINRKLATK
jgi:nicotinamide phosphoribosyltransferase